MLRHQKIIDQILPGWIKTESGGNPNAVSGAGAVGLLQLMPETAKRFGVTNSRDPQQNLAGGKAYLDSLITRYHNDIPTALAAYHAGEANMDNYLAGKKSGVGPLTKAYPGKVLAGFLKQQAAPRPAADPYPITQLPPVAPQSPIVPAKGEAMPIVQQQAQPIDPNAFDFSKQKAGISRQKLLAQYLMQNQHQQDPNAMVSGRVVGVNPMGALADTLSGLAGVYMQSKAQDNEESMNSQKTKAISDMVQGGKANMENLAASGLISPEELAKHLVKQSSKTDDYQFLPGEGGTWLKGNKGTGEIVASDFKNPLYDPNQQQVLTGVKEGGKYREINAIENGQVVPRIVTNSQAAGIEPISAGGQDYTFGSSFLGNQGAPRQAPAIASPGQLEAEKAAAKLPAEAQMEAIKNSGAVNVAQQKANIENQQKLDQKTNEQAAGGKKGMVTLDSMMKYLYPGGKQERDDKGRLIPPKEAMLLGNSPLDRAAMLGHQYGLHNDKASNLMGLRRLVGGLVMDANNGSLGAGVSNADVQFLKQLQGVTDSAQDPADIYNAIADNEEKFNRLMGAAQSQSHGATDSFAPAMSPDDLVKHYLGK